MTLASLQSRFARYLLEGDDRELAPSIHADWFEPGERLAVYRNNFLISLSEALTANFPVTTLMLGADFMRQVARRFIATCPPQTPRLIEYGAGFAEFLAGLVEVRPYPFVPEMASFEWLRIRAWDAETQKCLAAADFAGPDAPEVESLHVMLAKHVGILWHSYAVIDMHSAHQAPNPAMDRLDMTPRRHQTVVCRRASDIVAFPVTPRQAELLQVLRAPCRLTMAIESIFAGDQLEATQIMTLALQHALLVSSEPEH